MSAESSTPEEASQEAPNTVGPPNAEAPELEAPELDAPSVPDGPLPIVSPTLAAFSDSAPSRLPSPATICGSCPNSVWFASADELKCYCRVMFLITWHSKEPQVMTHCDGIFSDGPE